MDKVSKGPGSWNPKINFEPPDPVQPADTRRNNKTASSVRRASDWRRRVQGLRSRGTPDFSHEWISKKIVFASELAWPESIKFRNSAENWFYLFPQEDMGIYRWPPHVLPQLTQLIFNIAQTCSDDIFGFWTIPKMNNVSCLVWRALARAGTTGVGKI